MAYDDTMSVDYDDEGTSIELRRSVDGRFFTFVRVERSRFGSIDFIGSWNSIVEILQGTTFIQLLGRCIINGGQH